MKGKVVMVTGANSGIGKVTATQLARQGAQVVMVCRDAGKAAAAADDVRRDSGSDAVEIMRCDFGSQRSIRELAEGFKREHDKLHVLVNNAGALHGERRLSEDGIELTFAANHLGYFLLTNLLLDPLKRSAPARIVSVSSDAHRVGALRLDDINAEHGYSQFGAYGQSKLANIMFTYELARRLDGTGVTANCLHPGVVATRFGSSGSALMRFAVDLAKPLMRSPEKGAATSIYLASSPDVDGVSGRYFKNRRAIRSSKPSYDEAAQRRLWELSEKLTSAGASVASAA